MKRVYVYAISAFICIVSHMVCGATDSNHDGVAVIANEEPQPRLTIEVAPGVVIDLVYIPGGTFTMGATPEHNGLAGKEEYPTHQVTLSGYYIATTECTQQLWNVIMSENPSSLKGDRLPVTNINVYDCDEFISELSAKTHRRFALPTEAQWEYAARGAAIGNGYRFSGSNEIAQVAWYDLNASQPHIVATRQPNEIGLYDMSGNVYEICGDEYKNYTADAVTDPLVTGSWQQIYRGGAYNALASDCRVTARSFAPSDFSADFIGFRLVMLP